MPCGCGKSAAAIPRTSGDLEAEEGRFVVTTVAETHTFVSYREAQEFRKVNGGYLTAR